MQRKEYFGFVQRLDQLKWQPNTQFEFYFSEFFRKIVYNIKIVKKDKKFIFNFIKRGKIKKNA